MKVVKKVIMITTGVLLFASVLGLTMSYTIKNFIVKEVAPKAIKELMREEYVKTNDLAGHKLEVLDRVFYDKKTSSTIAIIVDNFIDYRGNKKAYKVPEKDLAVVREFMVAHNEDLSEFSGEDLTDEHIIEHFQVEVINDEVRDIFEKVDKDLNKSEKLVLTVYSKATSNSTRTILMVATAVMIGVIILLNLPISGSLGKIGVSILASGLIVAIMYVGVLVLKDKITSALKMDPGSIKGNMFLIWSIVEIGIGTCLIVIKKLLPKKTNVETTE